MFHLAMFRDPVSEYGENSHRGCRTSYWHFPLGGLTKRILRNFLEEANIFDFNIEIFFRCTEVGRSRGLLEPAVATAKACADGEKLHLNIFDD